MSHLALRRVVLAAAVLGASLAFPAPAGTDPSPGFGVNFHCGWSSYTDAQRQAVVAKLADAGATWVRIDVGWSAMEEPGRARVATWYRDRIDRCVELARARGLSVLLLLWSTPRWANGGRGVNVPPNDPAEFARFAGWAAARYEGKARAVQVWNEPSLSGFWSGSVDAYAALLKAAYPRIKAAAPRTTVVLGGPAYADDAWLSAAYAAGIKGSFDAASCQPYQSASDLAPEAPDVGTKYRLAHLPAFKAVMDRNGDGHKAVWLTEIGWSAHANPSGTPPWARGVSESRQGEYLRRAVEYVRANYPYVTHLFWYNERNKVGTSSHEANFGLLRSDLSPKPAYHALEALYGPG